MQKNTAIATDTEAPQTDLILLNKHLPSQSKLVALWQLDEHSKLYCLWIPQTTNINK